MKLIMLGAPGVGKGTHSAIIAKKLNIPTISTGNILREAVKNGTPTGLKAKEYMESGRLVPDDVIIGIVSERLEKPDCANGYILDGVPRTAGQAEALESAGLQFDKVISFEVSDEEIEERMTGRRFCSKCNETYHTKYAPAKVDGSCDKCGGELKRREDDEPATVRDRLAVYHQETEPLKGYYEKKGILATVISMEKIADTTAQLLNVLGIE